MEIINESKKLPTLKGFINEQEDEAPASDTGGGDDISPEAQLAQTLGDIADSRNDLLDQKKESDAAGDLIASATIDIDIKILDLNAQIARLEADKANIALQGV